MDTEFLRLNWTARVVVVAVYIVAPVYAHIRVIRDEISGTSRSL